MLMLYLHIESPWYSIKNKIIKKIEITNLKIGEILKNCPFKSPFGYKT